MDRLTYKSSMGDYGSAKTFEDEFSEKCALRNKLGKYEDLGYTPEELQKLIDKNEREAASYIDECDNCNFYNVGEDK